MFQIRSYLKFLLKSTNQHGVHSPFVYGLVTRCFYDRKRHLAYNIISEFRKILRSNGTKIRVTDFGAGSRVFSSGERKVSAIAGNAGISPRRARLLNRLIRYLEIENALELGTSLGQASAAMAAGNKVQVLTVEGCPATASIAKNQFERFQLKNIQLAVGEFDEFLGRLQENGKRLSRKEGGELEDFPLTETPDAFDLVYFDGNHQKEATLNYFRKLLPFAHNDSVFIFDDIHWSREMEEAWEEIKLHPLVKVSIDTFRWGLVFFRREQAKEHFKIRL